jgi:hypothetical protein
VKAVAGFSEPVLTGALTKLCLVQVESLGVLIFGGPGSRGGLVNEILVGGERGPGREARTNQMRRPKHR